MEVMSTLQCLGSNSPITTKVTYTRSMRTNADEKGWRAMRLPDPEELAVRRYKELMNQLTVKEPAKVTCRVCGVRPPFQVLSDECCKKSMNTPCIWDDRNRLEIEENQLIYRRATKRLEKKYPDPLDQIHNDPPSSDEEENLTTEVMSGTRPR